MGIVHCIVRLCENILPYPAKAYTWERLHNGKTKRGIMVHMEDRLSRLEETLYFQEQTIVDLNDALTNQQKELDETLKRLATVEERLRTLTLLLSNDGGEDTGPPPHYL